MNKQPFVSIIITTRNNIRTIERCLRTAKNQTYKKTELIVVDNHSTDGTLEVAKKIADKVYTKGPERSAQRNFGARKAKGDYLLIHDSDIYFPKIAVKECVDIVVKNPEVKAVILPEKSIGEGFWAKVKAFEREFYVGNDLIEAARFFEKKAFFSVNGYDEELNACEDWDLQNKITSHKYVVRRTASNLFHDEGKLQLSKTKKKYYAPWINKYKNKYPEISKKQFSLARFGIKKIILKGLQHPILSIAMIIMKIKEHRSTS